MNLSNWFQGGYQDYCSQCLSDEAARQSKLFQLNQTFPVPTESAANPGKSELLAPDKPKFFSRLSIFGKKSVNPVKFMIHASDQLYQSNRPSHGANPFSRFLTLSTVNNFFVHVRGGKEPVSFPGSTFINHK
jgi:hypothetical protein